MTTYGRPGVYVSETPLPQSINVVENSSSRGVFIGALPKGPIVPTAVSSWSQFVKTFGGPSTKYMLPTSIYHFFSNGGRNAIIVRSAGSNDGVDDVTPVSASTTFLDAASDGSLVLSCISPGAWANSGGDSEVSATITGNANNYFNVSIYQKVGSTTQLVEQFNDLLVDPNSSRYAVAIINAGSNLVTASWSVEGGARPAGTTASPVTQTFSGGVTAVDNVVTANGSAVRALKLVDYQDALALLDVIDAPMVINLPDVAYYFTTGGDTNDLTDQEEIYSELVSYCELRNDAFAVLDTPLGYAVSDALSFAEAVKSTNDGGAAAIYYPWVSVPDTLRNIPGATMLVPPGAGVVGQYLATDSTRGVFKTPAGLNNRVALAVSTERRFTNAELDDLNAAAVPVNPIRAVPGSGIVIMGGRTLKNVPGDRYINVRRTLIYLKKELTDMSAFAVFENNDYRLWKQLRASLGRFLLDFWSNGGLRGATPAQSFYIKCDETNNTVADVLAGQVNIEIGVALEYPAEFVVINIGQMTGDATL